MQAAASSPSGPAVTESEPRDWLGYQRYADALWGRVVHNFALDADARSAARHRSAESSGLPTGDPLVVGVYGEWGVGKSRLLELMYQRAARQNAEDCLQRARDPHAFAASPALRLTVPVWFHPWKYEHEPHLAVPLLMHLAEAVQRTLGDAASFGDQARQLLKDRQEDAKAVAGELAKVAKGFQAAAKVAHKIAGNGLVKTTASLAGGYFGFGAVAERTLGWVEETAARFIPPEEGGKTAGPPADPASPPPAPAGHATPTASADGRYYYNVHRYLAELSHITPGDAKRLGYTTLRQDLHLNFVIFVDDLDRCLPEKAVEVLEVIKTVLNVDSFAFVVALDDEVIERGISYRYRDYRIQHLKPDMPITGFEYLEKIVHLPFRLPQLTRAQAVEFLRRQEDRLLAPTASDPVPAGGVPTRLWFVPDPSTGDLVPSTLVPLLLDSFDAFVPRKLARTLELMHQFQQVFIAKGSPLQPPPVSFNPTGQAADARMVLCCVLLQLFAPEIFRLLRRRPELFGHWMRAYLVQESAREPVFIWRKSAADQLMTLEVSDADLYRWVALGSQAGASTQPATPNIAVEEGVPFSPMRESWGPYLGGAGLSASDRYSVEQVRLPLAAALSGFREMQRHAFAPLRLGGAMAYATGWTSGAVPLLRDYLNLFSDQVLPATGGASATAGAPAPGVVPPPPSVATKTAAPAPVVSPGGMSPVASPVMPPQVPSPPVQVSRPARPVQPGQFMELMRSSDASTRASLVERLGLQPGEVVDTPSLARLAAALHQETSLDPRRLLEALAVLAPFLDPDSVEKSRPWPAFAEPPELASMPMPPEACLDLCRPYAVLASYRLDTPLGLGVVMRRLQKPLAALVGDAATPLPLRAAAADQLGAIGDPVFEFDSGLAWLPRRRARVVPADGNGWQDSTPEEEPVPGFVRTPPDGNGAPAVYLGRTLVTVRQFEAFIDDGGYAQDQLWDADGLAWRMGAFDAVAHASINPSSMRALATRQVPWRWSEQRATPGRPVVGICWYEARAYAAWLSLRLHKQLEMAGIGRHRVRLPTETEWARCVQARNVDHVDAREWPWGGPGALSNWAASPLANVDITRLGSTSSVGLFPPGPLGVFDLAGNVWEWMDNLLPPVGGEARRIDSARPMRYAEEGLRDYPGVSLRGGSWQHSLDAAKWDVRVSRMPWEHDDTVGLRVALVDVAPSPA
ncbi:SUMF1/EgtB/PvdO family nonheme iron enzyme [Ideonella sp. DXS29W]|uniref:SUMF1/EgtB/PvdO family nonheme iron enzyme n=1 Tax=Ideonella lacteola TaxID=2984193 RepID=A0ABU9BKB7_9BURK